MANVCLLQIVSANIAESAWEPAVRWAGWMTYIDLPRIEAELQVVVDGLVGDFAQQREVGDTDLFLLCTLKGGLLDLGLSPTSSTITHIGRGLGAPKATTLLLTTDRTP